LWYSFIANSLFRFIRFDDTSPEIHELSFLRSCCAMCRQGILICFSFISIAW
jgi:hypothetical protein